MTFAGDICRHRAAEGRSTHPALPQLGFLCSSASFSECGSQAEWETGEILDPGNKSGAVRLGWLHGGVFECGSEGFWSGFVFSAARL